MYEQRKGGGEFKHSAEEPNVCQEESLGRKLDEGQVLENLDRHTREIRKV